MVGIYTNIQKMKNIFKELSKEKLSCLILVLCIGVVGYFGSIASQGFVPWTRLVIAILVIASIMKGTLYLVNGKKE